MQLTLSTTERQHFPSLRRTGRPGSASARPWIWPPTLRRKGKSSAIHSSRSVNFSNDINIQHHRVYVTVYLLVCLPFLILMFYLTLSIGYLTGGEWSDRRDESEARRGFPGPGHLEARPHWKRLSSRQRQGRGHQNTPQRHRAHPQTPRWGTAYMLTPTHIVMSFISLMHSAASEYRHDIQYICKSTVPFRIVWTCAFIPYVTPRSSVAV